MVPYMSMVLVLVLVLAVRKAVAPRMTLVALAFHAADGCKVFRKWLLYQDIAEGVEVGAGEVVEAALGS